MTSKWSKIGSFPSYSFTIFSCSGEIREIYFFVSSKMFLSLTWMLLNESLSRSLRIVVVLLYSVKSSWVDLFRAIFFHELSHFSISDLASATRTAAFLPSAAVRMMAP